MTALRLVDVRAAMPVGRPLEMRTGDVRAIAVHHSATANAANGLGLDDSRSIFEHQVLRRGWSHGGYHYCILPTGVIEYCLDEAVAGYHAGFTDPDDSFGLEHGQYWNEHCVAICLVGWFESGRTIAGRPVPDRFVTPTAAQWASLVDLIADVRARYGLPADTIRGHRELEGCATRCPGNVDLDALRAAP